MTDLDTHTDEELEQKLPRRLPTPDVTHVTDRTCYSA
jgi:hypothetical protein